MKQNIMQLTFSAHKESSRRSWQATFVALSLTGLVFMCKEALAINSVLDINGTFPYLINKTNGQLIEPRDYLDFDNIYNQNETYRRQQTVQSKTYHLLKAFDFANYFQSDYWHYSNEEDLRLSAAPVADVNLCAHHLNWLESQLNRSSAELFKRGEQHVNLMTLMDSFGRPEATTYLGHGYWLGSHYECLRTQVDMDKFESELECQDSEACERARPTPATSLGQLKTRYCIGKARDIDWPNSEQDNYTPTITYKVGLCLPETCETLSFAHHRSQLERLMRFQLPEYLKSRIYLNNLYCLPDSRSPVRALSLSARIFLGLCAAWLVVLVASTSLYSCYKRHQRDLGKIIIAEQRARLVKPNEEKHCKLDLVEPDQQQSAEAQFKLGYMANGNSTGMAGNVIASGTQLLIIKTQAAAASLARAL